MRMLLSVVFLAGCATSRMPVSFQPPVSGATSTTFEVAFKASSKQVVYLQEAFSEILGILASTDFAAEVKGFPPQSLGTTADGSCKTTTFLSILKDLQTRLPKSFTIKSRPSAFHTQSTAGTRPCGSLNINAKQIDLWSNGPREKLINTMAHEMTHLIPISECGTAGMYTDKGHLQCNNNVACNDAFLASYAWGDLIECAFLKKKDSKLDLYSCLLKTVNGYKLDRTSMTLKLDNAPDCQAILSWARKPVPQ